MIEKSKVNGFTLVELLIVIAVLVVTSTVLFQVFSNTLKGGGKAQYVSTLKQNSQSALDIMDKAVRSASSVVCSTVTPPVSLVIQNSDGTYTRLRFPVQISGSNGYIEKEALSYPVSTSACQDGSVSPKIITDNDPKNGVSVTNGQFTVNSAPGLGYAVTMQFMVNPPVSLSPVFSSQIGSVTMKTTVSLRGYTPFRSQ